jgi:hypothetical protein
MLVWLYYVNLHLPTHKVSMGDDSQRVCIPPLNKRKALQDYVKRNFAKHEYEGAVLHLLKSHEVGDHITRIADITNLRVRINTRTQTYTQ